MNGGQRQLAGSVPSFYHVGTMQAPLPALPVGSSVLSLKVECEVIPSKAEQRRTAMEMARLNK